MALYGYVTLDMYWKQFLEKDNGVKLTKRIESDKMIYSLKGKRDDFDISVVEDILVIRSIVSSFTVDKVFEKIALPRNNCKVDVTEDMDGFVKIVVE